jgi:hypothetical protein
MINNNPQLRHAEFVSAPHFVGQILMVLKQITHDMLLKYRPYDLNPIGGKAFA